MLFATVLLVEGQSVTVVAAHSFFGSGAVCFVLVS